MAKNTNNNKTKKLIYLLVSTMVIVVVVTFLMMEDFRYLYSSLVKQYWGGSSQCVAYVQKYYKDVFGIDLKYVGRAQELYIKAPQYNLYAHRNGGITSPQPGDILVFGHRNRVGHVAIVTGVIREGVLIVEQNWGTSRITTNNGHPLPLVIEEGTYTMPDRADYYVVGWVSRTLNNPGTFFDFSQDYSGGWIIENDIKRMEGGPDDVWSVQVRGKNPTLVSPIYEQPISMPSYGKVVFRGRIKGNLSASQGKIFLRDEKDIWKHEVPFVLSAGEDFQEVNVDLSLIEDDIKITQMKLMFDSSPVVGVEQWELDWLRIVTSQNEFPVD